MNGSSRSYVEQQQQKNPDSETLCFLHYMEIQNKALAIKDMFQLQ